MEAGNPQNIHPILSDLKKISSLNHEVLAQEIALNIFASTSGFGILTNEFSSDPPLHENATFIGLVACEHNAVRWLEDNASCLGIDCFLQDLNSCARDLCKTTDRLSFRDILEKLIFATNLERGCSWSVMAILFFFVKSLAAAVAHRTRDYTEIKHISSAFLISMKRPVNFNTSHLWTVWIPLEKIRCRLQAIENHAHKVPQLKLYFQFSNSFENVTREIVIAVIGQFLKVSGLHDAIYAFPDQPPFWNNQPIVDYFLAKVHDECSIAKANSTFPTIEKELEISLKLFSKSPDIRLHYELKRKLNEIFLCQHEWGRIEEADWLMMSCFFHYISQMAQRICCDFSTGANEKITLCKTLADVAYELFLEKKTTTDFPDYSKLLI